MHSFSQQRLHQRLGIQHTPFIDLRFQFTVHAGDMIF